MRAGIDIVNAKKGVGDGLPGRPFLHGLKGLKRTAEAERGRAPRLAKRAEKCMYLRHFLELQAGMRRRASYYPD